MSNRTFALLVENESKRFFSGNTFLTTNNTIFQILRDIDFSPEITPNNYYNIKLISYDNKTKFVMDRENYNYVATFNFDFTNDDVELLKNYNKIYKESTLYIDTIKYNLGIYFSYYIDEKKQDNVLTDTKNIYFMSHPFLSINE